MHIKRQSSIITLTQGRRILDIGKSSFLSLLVLIIAKQDWFIDMLLIVSNLNDCVFSVANVPCTLLRIIRKHNMLRYEQKQGISRTIIRSAEKVAFNILQQNINANKHISLCHIQSCSKRVRGYTICIYQFISECYKYIHF